MDIIIGKNFAMDTWGLQVFGTDIGISSEYKPEHTPFPSFTFNRKQLWELKRLIDQELEAGDYENIQRHDYKS